MGEIITIKLRESSTKGLKVLLLDPDFDRARVHEDQAALDPALQRVDIYTASKLREALDLVRREKIQLALIPENYADKDFIDQILELRSSYTAIDVICFLNQPAINLISQAKKLGVYDFASYEELIDYEALKMQILCYAREHQGKSERLKHMFQQSINCQRILALSDPWAPELKSLSHKILHQLFLHYDFSGEDCAYIAAAEQIYLPHLSVADYEWLEAQDEYGLMTLLKSTGSWTLERKPQQAGGFIITLANFFAYCWQRGALDLLTASVESRAPFLQHPSIRTLSAPLIKILWQNLSHLDREKKAG